MLDFYKVYSSTILPITIVIFLAYVFGRAFLGRWLAIEKNRQQAVWFWLCFFFGIFALIVLGFAPPNNIKKSVLQKPEPHNPDMSVTWKCPKCGIENANNSYVCKSCGYKIT